MLYAGLDLSRQRLDVHPLDEDGRTVEVTAVRPDADALRGGDGGHRPGADPTSAACATGSMARPAPPRRRSDMSPAGSPTCQHACSSQAQI